MTDLGIAASVAANQMHGDDGDGRIILAHGDIRPLQSQVESAHQTLDNVDQIFPLETGEGGSAPVEVDTSANMLAPPPRTDPEIIRQLWEKVKDMRRRRRARIDEAWRRLGELGRAAVEQAGPPSTDAVAVALREIVGHAYAAAEVTETLQRLGVLVSSRQSLLETMLFWRLSESVRTEMRHQDLLTLVNVFIEVEEGFPYAWPFQLSPLVFPFISEEANHALALLEGKALACWAPEGDDERAPVVHDLALEVLHAATVCAGSSREACAHDLNWSNWRYAMMTLKRYPKYWRLWGDALQFLSVHFFGSTLLENV